MTATGGRVPLDRSFAAQATDLAATRVAWWRAGRKHTIRRQVRRLNEARAVLAAARVFHPWRPTLSVRAGDVLEGRYTDPTLACTLCKATVPVRVVTTDPVVLATQAVHAGRMHGLTCPADDNNYDTPRKDDDGDDGRAAE